MNALLGRVRSEWEDSSVTTARLFCLKSNRASGCVFAARQTSRAGSFSCAVLSAASRFNLKFSHSPHVNQATLKGRGLGVSSFVSPLKKKKIFTFKLTETVQNKKESIAFQGQRCRLCLNRKMCRPKSNGKHIGYSINALYSLCRAFYAFYNPCVLLFYFPKIKHRLVIIHHAIRFQ